MKIKGAFLLVILLTTQEITLAQRVLEPDEIHSILKTITSHPRRTWIPAGTITAKHDEYKAPLTTDPDVIDAQIHLEQQNYLNQADSPEKADKLRVLKFQAIPANVRYKITNEYSMQSNVIIKYDGRRFFWQIDIISRSDSVRTNSNNMMIENFNTKLNQTRIFAWDGAKYTTYFKSGNHATVNEPPRDIPVVVNGCLTAGVIPWGYGIYEYNQLVTADLSATEIVEKDKHEIHLSCLYPDDSEMFFVLDPDKEYAVLYYALNKIDNFLIIHTYDNFQLVGSDWVPRTIEMERYDNTDAPPRLLNADYWTLKSIKGRTPLPAEFQVDYEPDTSIEHFIGDYHRSIKYVNPENSSAAAPIDTDYLLNERLAILSETELYPQNCATAVLSHIADQYGISINPEQLARLVENNPQKTTSLYQLTRFIKEYGLYGQAVQTNLKTLKTLQKNYQIILYLPDNQHFVVLGNIDKNHVFIIDLNSDRILYQTRCDRFQQLWQGTAVIIDNKPLNLPAQITTLDDSSTQTITGSENCHFGCYSCTELLQEATIEACPEPIYETCYGYYTEYFTRMGPELSTSGFVRGTGMPRSRKASCQNNPYWPGECMLMGEWIYYYMRACD
ncbi:MAG: hypothetical protein JW860_04605 [Sedimentisphaerales bacterium]|nr:hypothetical protein [Sedimentisphaerales bacterium]